MSKWKDNVDSELRDLSTRIWNGDNDVDRRATANIERRLEKVHKIWSGEIDRLMNQNHRTQEMLYSLLNHLGITPREKEIGHYFVESEKRQ